MLVYCWKSSDVKKAKDSHSKVKVKTSHFKDEIKVVHLNAVA